MPALLLDLDNRPRRKKIHHERVRSRQIVLWGALGVRNRAGRHVWDVGVAADVRKKTILFPNRDKIGTSFSARVELVGVKLLSAPIGS